MKPWQRKSFLGAAVVAALFVAGCGVKSIPLPPESVRPEQIIDLRAVVVSHGVQLTWSRPEHYSGGQQMRDLGSFTIVRAPEDGPYVPLVQIPVTDQERFAVARTFSYFDNSVKRGNAYRYEVISHTTDGYDSLPSNEAEIVYGRRQSPAGPMMPPAVPPAGALMPAAPPP